MVYEINTLIHEYIYNDILTVADAQLPWNKMNNKTILITGAGGFIGYYLTMAMLIRNDLYGDNIKVIALVRNKEKTEKRFGDVLNRDDIKVVVQDVCSDIDIEDKADYVRTTSASRATTPPTTPVSSPKPPPCCAWKICTSSWILSPTATPTATPSRSLTRS